jgi:hypothetical protein
MLWCHRRVRLQDGMFVCGNPSSDFPYGNLTCPGPLGQDWVDWHVSRAVGKTFIFESWHASYTLGRIASLHAEFAPRGIGNATLAAAYRARAARISVALRAQYRGGDHVNTVRRQGHYQIYGPRNVVPLPPSHLRFYDVFVPSASHSGFCFSLSLSAK